MYICHNARGRRLVLQYEQAVNLNELKLRLFQRETGIIRAVSQRQYQLMSSILKRKIHRVSVCAVMPSYSHDKRTRRPDVVDLAAAHFSFYHEAF